MCIYNISIVHLRALTFHMPLVDNNWHLHTAWERFWPQIVHGSFLWGGEPLDQAWCENSSRWLDQLEDGELVMADDVYPRANYLVAPFLRRYDEWYVEVHTAGYATLGEAVRQAVRQQAAVAVYA